MPVKGMLCKKCGKELKQDAKFCIHCGDAVQPEIIPEEQKEKKKGKAKVWLIGAASFLFALGLLVAIFFADIVAWTERLVLSPETLMMKAFATAAQDAGFGAGEQAYAFGTPYRYSFGFYLDETLQNLLAVTAEGKENWISEMNLQITAGRDGDLQRTQMGVAVKDYSIVSIDVVQNKQKAWLGVPELNDRYLELIQTQQIDSWEDDLPDTREMKEILRTYGSIWVDSIHKVTKEKATLKIGGVSQEVLQLTATIRPEDARQAFAEMAGNMREDETVRKLLNGQSDTEDLRSELVKLLEDLSETADFGLELAAYLDGRNKLIGIELLDGGQNSLFYWAKAKSDGEFASLLTCGSFALSGSGTYSGDKETGRCRLSVDGKTVLTYELKAFALGKDGLSGSLIFVLPREWIASTELSLLNTDLCVELCQKTMLGKKALCFNLLAGDMPFMGLWLSGEKAKDFSVEIPQNTLPAQNDETLQVWLQSLDWGRAVKRLGVAGVPIDTLTDLLK